MTPEQSRVHKKLITKLPVRTHIVYDDKEEKSVHLRGPHGRSIIVHGKLYSSLKAARRALGCGVNKIHHLVEIGQAAWL